MSPLVLFALLGTHAIAAYMGAWLYGRGTANEPIDLHVPRWSFSRGVRNGDDKAERRSGVKLPGV